MNKKWALFFSGRGSNLEAILTRYHETWSTPPVVVTNNPEAAGILVARRFNLEPLILDSPINYAELSQHLKAEGVERIFLLGYLKIIPSIFIKAWTNRIFNLHPSLLPFYPGLRSIERAYSDKSDIGVTIHKVTEGVDEGQVLVQEVVVSCKNNLKDRARTGQAYQGRHISNDMTKGLDSGPQSKDYDSLSLEEIKLMVHSKEHQLVCDFIPMGEQHLGSEI